MIELLGNRLGTAAGTFLKIFGATRQFSAILLKKRVHFGRICKKKQHVFHQKIARERVSFSKKCKEKGYSFGNRVGTPAYKNYTSAPPGQKPLPPKCTSINSEGSIYPNTRKLILHECMNYNDSLHFQAGNMIRILEDLDKLTSLETLHLRDNQLEFLDGFSDTMGKLKYVNLR